jgi:ABC-2 type transport system permease protein
MAKIWAIALNELRVQLRQPATLVSMVLLPAALIFVIGLANGQALGDSQTVRQVRVDVLDADVTPQSAALLESVRALDASTVLCPMDEGRALGDGSVLATCGYPAGQTTLSEAELASRLESGSSSAYIEIPAGFASGLEAGEEVTIIYRNADDTPSDSPVLRALIAAVQRSAGVSVARRIAQNIADGVLNGDAAYVDAVTAQAAAVWATEPVTVSLELAPGNPAQTAPGFQQSVPGMGSMYVMSTVLAGAALLIAERKTMTLQRLATMPVTPAQIIGGKLAARFIIGMVQYGVAFGVGLVMGQVFGVSFGNDPLALLLVAASFTLCMSGLALFFATVVKTDEQAASLGTLLSLTLAPIGGAWWSLEMEFIPDFMQTLSYASPFRYAMDGFGVVIRQGGGLVDVLPSCAVLLVTGAVLFGLAVRRFRVA